MNADAHTVDAAVYARRWKTLAVLSLSLVIIGLDNTILNVALPSLREHFDASNSTLQWIVDSYLLAFAGLLLTYGHARRPVRAQARSAGRTRDLRYSQPGGARRRQRQPADRDPRRHGRRRCTHHAGNALDHHQRVPARGARKGHRDLGRHGGDRHRSWPAVRRFAPGMVLLDVRLPRQRARHRRRRSSRASRSYPRAAIRILAASTSSVPGSPSRPS